MLCSSSFPAAASLNWSPCALQKCSPHVGPVRKADEAVTCAGPENSLACNPQLASFSPSPGRVRWSWSFQLHWQHRHAFVLKIYLDNKIIGYPKTSPLTLKLMHSWIFSRHGHQILIFCISESSTSPISPIGCLSRTLSHSLTFESSILGMKSLFAKYHEKFPPPAEIHAYHFHFICEVNLFRVPFSTEIAIHLLILWLHKPLHQTIHRLFLSKAIHLCN